MGFYAPFLHNPPRPSLAWHRRSIREAISELRESVQRLAQAGRLDLALKMRQGDWGDKLWEVRYRLNRYREAQRGEV